MARRRRGTRHGARRQRRNAFGVSGAADAIPDERAVELPGREVSAEAQADINRVMAIWRTARGRYGEGNGAFLFGSFTIADAMYAPVVSRFRTYRFDVEREADEYCNAVTSLPAMQEWTAAARNEPMIVDAYEF